MCVAVTGDNNTSNRITILAFLWRELTLTMTAVFDKILPQELKLKWGCQFPPRVNSSYVFLGFLVFCL